MKMRKMESALSIKMSNEIEMGLVLMRRCNENQWVEYTERHILV